MPNCLAEHCAHHTSLGGCICQFLDLTPIDIREPEEVADRG